MLNNHWHADNIEHTLKRLDTDREKGLTLAAVKKLSEQYLNKIEEENRISPARILLEQFTDTMVLVLLGATVISGVIGAMADAVTIMAIVILNAVLGFVQEYRAERSLDAIKKLASAQADVLRNGLRNKIEAEQLVPGDIIFIHTGDKIPADVRLLESYSLEVDESALTGESHPVAKKAEIVLAVDTELAERSNMAFMGTVVTRGRAQAVVVETGKRSIMGQIAGMIRQAERTMTPLQVKLDQLGKILIVICLGVCTLVAVMGVLRGEPIMTMLMAGISLAVAAIPEGLPAIVTVVLALGVQRMASRNAIVRKLPAVETLGCTTIICTDKTGTLTQNKMTVRKLAVINKEVDVDGSGYRPEGHFYLQGRSIKPLQDADIRLLMEIAYNCNNAILEKKGGEYSINGDPTDGALLVLAKKSGLQKKHPLLREIPFDSERKRMSVLVNRDGENILLVKGSLDILLGYCDKILENGRVRRLTRADIKRVLDIQDQWAVQALRVLGFAYRTVPAEAGKKLKDNELERDLILVGMCGIIDPPRPGVTESVATCLQAGIIPIMITGDHPETARAIAAEIGITSEDSAISGKEMDRLSDEEIYTKAIHCRVFARVTPEHKNRIVKVLKAHRHVVAMTGDGVNDAPAIKASDIGISMGISGTEVTKEASSIILTDDDFSTIVSAVYEGRAIYDNIRKFIRYLLGCNIGEVLVMFAASLFGMPLPMLPIQILWINLVTDGLPAMALGLEPPEPGIMTRKPRPRDESVFAHNLGKTIFSRGAYITVVTLVVFVIGLIYGRWHGIENLDTARTMAFTTLVFAQLFYVFECRSERYSPFELGMFKNRFLIIAVSCSVLMQLSAIYLSPLQTIFKTVPLEGWQWGVILLLTGSKMAWNSIQYTARRLLKKHSYQIA